MNPVDGVSNAPTFVAASTTCPVISSMVFAQVESVPRVIPEITAPTISTNVLLLGSTNVTSTQLVQIFPDLISAIVTVNQLETVSHAKV